MKILPVNAKGEPFPVKEMAKGLSAVAALTLILGGSITGFLKLEKYTDEQKRQVAEQLLAEVQDTTSEFRENIGTILDIKSDGPVQLMTSDLERESISKSSPGFNVDKLEGTAAKPGENGVFCFETRNLYGLRRDTSKKSKRNSTTCVMTDPDNVSVATDENGKTIVQIGREKAVHMVRVRDSIARIGSFGNHLAIKITEDGDIKNISIRRVPAVDHWARRNTDDRCKLSAGPPLPDPRDESWILTNRGFATYFPDEDGPLCDAVFDPLEGTPLGSVAPEEVTSEEARLDDEAIDHRE